MRLAFLLVACLAAAGSARADSVVINPNANGWQIVTPPGEEQEVSFAFGSTRIEQSFLRLWVKLVFKTPKPMVAGGTYREMQMLMYFDCDAHKAAVQEFVFVGEPGGRELSRETVPELKFSVGSPGSSFELSTLAVCTMRQPLTERALKWK